MNDIHFLIELKIISHRGRRPYVITTIKIPKKRIPLGHFVLMTEGLEKVRSNIIEFIEPYRETPYIY